MYVSPPISYAKVNPVGQLIVGLENGTVLSAGNVIGPPGIQGVTGPTGRYGPTGPRGPTISTMHINKKDELTFTFSDSVLRVYTAGKVPTSTGPTGPRGHSISHCQLDQGGNLIFTSENGRNLVAGKVVGATGPQGPTGMMGTRGEQGRPFTLSKIFTTNHQLMMIDDTNRIHKCGYVGITGPTGPPLLFDKIYLDTNNQLLFITNDGLVYNAGTLPTGPRGRPGPRYQLKNIQLLENGDLVFTDEYQNKFNAGTISGIQELRQEITQLRRELTELRSHLLH